MNTLLPTKSGENIAPQAARLSRRLIALLKKELLLQHRLLAVATETREAIVERDIELLTRLHRRQDEMLTEAENLAGDRLHVGWEIARHAGVPTADLTLSKISECGPASAVVQMHVVRSMLVEVAKKVQSAQTLNRQLLENEMDYIGASLEVLARAAAPRKGYTSPLQRIGTPSIILDKAA